MPSTPKQDELRTFTVTVHVHYTINNTVRARTVRGASAAAAAAAAIDYPGAEIHAGQVTERRREEK